MLAAIAKESLTAELLHDNGKSGARQQGAGSAVGTGIGIGLGSRARFWAGVLHGGSSGGQPPTAGVVCVLPRLTLHVTVWGHLA